MYKIRDAEKDNTIDLIVFKNQDGINKKINL